MFRLPAVSKYSSISCSENQAGSAGDGSGVRIGAGNPGQRIKRAAGLVDPGVPAISRGEDGAAVTDSGSVIGVGKGNAPQIVMCATYLREPVVSSVGCSQDCAK